MDHEHKQQAGVGLRKFNALVRHIMTYPMAWIYPTLVRVSYPGQKHAPYSEYREVWAKRYAEIKMSNDNHEAEEPKEKR